MPGGAAWSQYLLGSDQSAYMGTYSAFNYDVDYGWYNNVAQFAPMLNQALADGRQYRAFANMGMSSLTTQLTAPGTAFSILDFPGGLLAGWYGSGSLTDSFKISDYPYIGLPPVPSEPWGLPSNIWQSKAIPSWWVQGPDIDVLLDYVIKLNYLAQLPR